MVYAAAFPWHKKAAWHKALRGPARRQDFRGEEPALQPPSSGAAGRARRRAVPRANGPRPQEEPSRLRLRSVSAAQGTPSAAEHGTANGGEPGPVKSCAAPDDEASVRRRASGPVTGIGPPSAAGCRRQRRPRPRLPAHCREALAATAAHAHCGRTASPVPPGPAPGEPRAPAAGLPGRGGAAAAGSDYL